MTMRHALFALAAAFAALTAMPAVAQNSVVLYGGYRSGGSFEQSVDAGPYTASNLAGAGAAGLSVDRALDAGRNAQLFLSTQRTTLQLAPGTAGAPSELPLTITYLQFGGSNFFDGRAGQGGYVAGGLGVTLMSPRADGLTSELRPSFSLAIGYEQALATSVALRLELRGYLTMIRSSGGFFCSGGCVVVIRGDALAQADALVGVSVRF
jgi:hypothetical protein